MSDVVESNCGLMGSHFVCEKYLDNSKRDVVGLTKIIISDLNLHHK